MNSILIQKKSSQGQRELSFILLYAEFGNLTSPPLPLPDHVPEFHHELLDELELPEPEISFFIVSSERPLVMIFLSVPEQT